MNNTTNQLNLTGIYVFKIFHIATKEYTFFLKPTCGSTPVKNVYEAIKAIINVNCSESFKICYLISNYKNRIKLEITIQWEPRKVTNVWKLTLSGAKRKCRIRKYVGMIENKNTAC